MLWENPTKPCGVDVVPTQLPECPSWLPAAFPPPHGGWPLFALVFHPLELRSLFMLLAFGPSVDRKRWIST